MSVDLDVYLRRASMPKPSDWQEAIRAAGFPVEIDTGFDVDTFTGFLPCKLDNQISGFEYSASPLDPEEARELEAPAGADFSVTFVTHANLRELAASLAAASVLLPGQRRSSGRPAIGRILFRRGRRHLGEGGARAVAAEPEVAVLRRGDDCGNVRLPVARVAFGG